MSLFGLAVAIATIMIGVMLSVLFVWALSTLDIFNRKSTVRSTIAVIVSAIATIHVVGVPLMIMENVYGSHWFVRLFVLYGAILVLASILTPSSRRKRRVNDVRPIQ